MSIRNATLSVVFLAALIPAALAEEPKEQAAPDEPQWTEFHSAERGFAVSFPGKPSATSTPVVTAPPRELSGAGCCPGGACGVPPCG